MSKRKTRTAYKTTMKVRDYRMLYLSHEDGSVVHIRNKGVLNAFCVRFNLPQDVVWDLHEEKLMVYEGWMKSTSSEIGAFILYRELENFTPEMWKVVDFLLEQTEFDLQRILRRLPSSELRKALYG